MAVAGLQNVTMFDSSVHGESQSAQSSQWGEPSRPSNRASSLLQMWRELEGEHVVNHPNSRLGTRIERQRSDRSNTDSESTFFSDGLESVNGNETLETNEVHNECDHYSPDPVGYANEYDDSNSIVSEQSADLGEVERERVRQIFREWMNNNGAKSHASHVSHRNNHSRGQWLGENERERVRIIMDWVQVNCEQRGNCDSPIDEGASEIGSQIELVRDGSLVNHGEIPERKAMRKLCGRQAVLDLLARARRETKRELQELLDHRPVSNFSHRNRIQSLLKGRFLRNERMIQDERLNSRAASELVLLRRRHTVSDLREGFQCRSVSSVHGSLNSSESGDASFNEDRDNCRNDQLVEVQEDPEDIYDLFERSDEERERNDFHAAVNLEINASGNANGQHSVVQAVERQELVLREGDRELELVSNGDYMCVGQPRETDVSENQDADDNVLVQETSGSAHGQLLDANELLRVHDETSSEMSNVHQAGGTVEGDRELELVSNGDYMCVGQPRETDVSENQDADDNVLVQETSGSEGSAHGQLLDANELLRVHDETSSEMSNVHQAGGTVEGVEVNAAEDMEGHETSAQVEEGQESALHHEELEWQQLTHTEPDEWADGNEEGLARNWQENITNQWDQERPDNDFREHDHMPEPHEDWHENGFQEAIDSWLVGPSEQQAGSFGRVNAFYFPEDDNVYSVELRELLSRRHVSSLLRSGFRASLDQLIQSYVERQGNASMDWDPDGTSSPEFIEQDQEQQNGDRVQESYQFLNSDRVLPTDDSAQSLLDQDLQPVNWSQRSSHHQLGTTEWEVISELRTDMVRLQQRMNSMQKMLEACMDMQLELHRSVRQEVSAALNRTTITIDACKDDALKDESKWQFVRKGICCICYEHNIDSLLYRCGHMCTCSRCAENLVQGKHKCPMCQAPVVEMVRAYSVQ